MYCVRNASTDDLSELSIIEREAFTESWPPTPFRRDLANRNVEILVVAIDMNLEQTPEKFEVNETLYENLGYIHRLFNCLNNLWRDAPGHDAKNIVGYVATRQMYDEAHITSIAVRKSFRGMGIGELLLMSAVSNAMKKNYRTTTLEVRVSNRIAQSLYKKYGFNEVGIRKRYYSDNKEDAYIMTTDTLYSDLYIEHFRKLVDAFDKRALNINWNLSGLYAD
ncbi:MAG: ribosomal-protein-alanine N-acetyltransferase [SAR202 cluster bacterium]|nr:ribosomal-protein-alanine N-acetyltransferase [SAR202 cluster bacterium]|tara:strand:+ start:7358 stop:8023 length:666 start_codon:yes stop_codon:yes gene_type:complete